MRARARAALSAMRGKRNARRQPASTRDRSLARSQGWRRRWRASTCTAAAGRARGRSGGSGASTLTRTPTWCTLRTVRSSTGSFRAGGPAACRSACSPTSPGTAAAAPPSPERSLACGWGRRRWALTRGRRRCAAATSACRSTPRCVRPTPTPTDASAPSTGLSRRARLR